tara:strand:- start:70 stop:390 length:321 start_codon:yes stop_codon:yes gene_type:complete
MNMEITEKPAEETSTNSSTEVTIDFSKVTLNINAQFLVNYRNILDATIERGTWKGNELSQIGAIYQSINDILQQVTSQVQQAKTESSNEVTKEEVAEEAEASTNEA